jgi:tRNA pseudouridine32 synthase / 23S rRNA pseudouridine746 synthase
LDTLDSYLMGENIDTSVQPPAYYYDGSTGGVQLRLPRTQLAECIARCLMQRLAADARCAVEGKMYGVLLVEAPTGERLVLKAFSGLLHGESTIAGWVPLIPGREQVSLDEARVLARLEAFKQALIALQHSKGRQELQALSQEFEQRQQALAQQHAQSKEERQKQRLLLREQLTGEALHKALEPLDAQSQLEGIARKRLKSERDRALQPLQQGLLLADAQTRALRQQRAEVSRQLQAQMHAHYWLSNFAGESQSLQQLMPDGSIPTGTGDCCAPKLLHYAAVHSLRPLAMAEFWWGPGIGGRVQGEFYGACAERCQPLIPFLLSGLSRPETTRSALEALPILYEDRWLLAVNKPTGLLSVPGRYHNNQDSVLLRLQHQRSDGGLMAVHRLDQDTSGILLFARDKATHYYLSQQFEQRRVRKVYEALLSGLLMVEQGMIALPLWGDPEDRPYQKVDWQRGKPSTTEFKLVAREGHLTRVELMPMTGRTHQLRVHVASPHGLHMAILGDRLYGKQGSASRLCLHARELSLTHPQSGKTLSLTTDTPF